MSHRVIVDASGVTWEVWEVEPTLIEKRDAASEPPSTGERRRVRAARLRVSPAMREGWLAVRSSTERRRIAPIPSGWFELDDAALAALVASAEVIGSPRRLIE
jgi:hypothetical protein